MMLRSTPFTARVSPSGPEGEPFGSSDRTLLVDWSVAVPITQLGRLDRTGKRRYHHTHRPQDRGPHQTKTSSRLSSARDGITAHG
jgi:hypothetical protein